MNLFVKKHKHTIVFITAILISSMCFVTLQGFKSSQTEHVSLDHLIPEGFVLVPIEIQNGNSIRELMGSKGVVNLYNLKNDTPKEIVAKALKIINLNEQDIGFTALVPEKQAVALFEHKGPFYAVIQNPKKQGSQIYKKKINKQLIIVEEKVENEE